MPAFMVYIGNEHFGENMYNAYAIDPQALLFMRLPRNPSCRWYVHFPQPPRLPLRELQRMYVDEALHALEELYEFGAFAGRRILSDAEHYAALAWPATPKT